MKRVLFVILAIVVPMLFLACPNPPGPVEYTISGQVFNNSSGNGVPGAKVLFGDYNATTDADGNFTITLPADVTTVTGTYAVYKDTDYSFSLIEDVTIDATANPVYRIGLEPNDYSSLPTRTLTGQIYLDGIPTEIEDDMLHLIIVVNEFGGVYGEFPSYTGGSGFSIDTCAFGQDCTVAIMANDHITSKIFSYYIEGADLTSGANVVFTKPASDLVEIDMTGEVLSIYEMYCWTQKTASGTEIPANAMYNDGVGKFDVYIPAGDTMKREHRNTIYNDPNVNDEMSKCQYKDFTNPMETASAFSITPPVEGVDHTTVTYNAGEISYSAPTGGADMYLVSIGDTNTSGFLVTRNTSIMLPDDFLDAVLTDAAFDVGVLSVNSSVINNADLIGNNFLGSKSHNGLANWEFIAVADESSPATFTK